MARNVNTIREAAETGDVMECIVQRSLDGERYTWVGPVLLYVINYDNPDHLDDNSIEEADSYASMMDFNSIAVGTRLKPCIANFVDRIKYRITNGISKRNQTLIIMGEVDTDTLHNFYEINSHLFTTNIDDSADCWEIQYLHKINSLVILISNFSAAHRNQSIHKDRSHRSVQFIKYFYHTGAICGASVNAFLLEPTRVTCKKENFLIFYQMMHSLSDEELDDLRLSRNAEYTILEYTYKQDRKSHYTAQFTSMVEIMEFFGVTENEKKDLFQILALLLHMGNIKFITNINECSIDLNDKPSKIAVQNTCYLLNIKKTEFVKLFKYSSIKSVKLKQKMFSAQNFCLSQLYGMMANIYELFFNWIVSKVRDFFLPSCDHAVHAEFGVLHISGFQYGTECNMEEFCTNYVAERMQLYFKEKYLEPEWKEYTDEGLIVQPMHPNIRNSKRNVEVIENIIMQTFNNICSTSILPTSEHMMEKLFEEEETSKKMFKIDEDTFLINHYANPIKYSCSDMMCKNIGKLPNNIITLIQSNCKNKLLQNLLKNMKKDTRSSNDSDRCTTLSKLKNNLDNLLAELAGSDLHFLRCFRVEHDEESIVDHPNDYELINQLRDQIAFSDFYNVITLARKEYVYKMTRDEYKNRYIFREHGVDDIKHNFARDIFQCEKIHRLHRFVGPNIIFLTEECFFKLEYYRQAYRLVVLKRRMVSVPTQHKSKWLAVSSSNPDEATRQDATVSRELSGNDQDSLNSNQSPIPKIENCVECLEMDDDGNHDDDVDDDDDADKNNDNFDYDRDDDDFYDDCNDDDDDSYESS